MKNCSGVCVLCHVRRETNPPNRHRIPTDARRDHANTTHDGLLLHAVPMGVGPIL